MENINKTENFNQQLVLVQQKIDLIESHMNWTITGVTATIGVLMAIFAVIQFVYQRKIENNKLKELEDTLTEKINNAVLKKADDLKATLEERVTNAEKTIERRSQVLEADLSRSFAISAEDANLHAIAFVWWVSAAAGYSETNQNTLLNTCIKAAKDTIHLTGSTDDIDKLLEHTTSIEKSLSTLGKKHSTESSLLKIIFLKKIESTPTVVNAEKIIN